MTLRSISRRGFAAALGAGFTAPSLLRAASNQPALPALPRIPRRTVYVAEYGGRGDGVSDNSAAIAAAVRACSAAGGGRVVLPRGVCLTGPIRLPSRIDLHVQRGTVLRFIPEPDRYLPPVLTRWEGVELMGYHPLIYAFEAEDVAVSGVGIIDGGADDRHWWPWKGPWAGRYDDTPERERQRADRDRLFAMAEAGVPVAERVFAADSRLRPPLFQPYRCRRTAISGVTIINAPFWLVHPVLCDEVTVRDVICRSHGPNNDGCDPESCRRVLIERCTFDTGDDCIALKAGRNADGRRIGAPCEDVLIRRCLMKDGHAGVAIGSELTGGIRRIVVEDCTMDSPSLARMLVVKTNPQRGGVVEDVTVRRVTVGQVATALIQLWCEYEEGGEGDYLPIIRRIAVEDCTVGSTGRVLAVRGLAGRPIDDLSLTRVAVRRAKAASFADHLSGLRLNGCTVAGRPFGVDDVRLRANTAAVCDKWAFCR